MNYLAEAGFEPLLFNSRTSLCALLIIRVIEDRLGPTPDQWVRSGGDNDPLISKELPNQKDLTMRKTETSWMTPDPSSMPGPQLSGDELWWGPIWWDLWAVQPASNIKDLCEWEPNGYSGTGAQALRGNHLLFLSPASWETAAVQQGLTATLCKAMGFCQIPWDSKADAPAPSLQVLKTWMMFWSDNSGHGLWTRPQAPLSRAVPTPSPGSQGPAGALTSEMRLGGCPRRGKNDVLKVAQVSGWWFRILLIWLLKEIWPSLWPKIMKGDKQLPYIYKWIPQNVLMGTCTPLFSSWRRSSKPALLIHPEARGLCCQKGWHELQLVSP